MYPGVHAKGRADQPAFIMAQTGVAVTYAERLGDEIWQRHDKISNLLERQPHLRGRPIGVGEAKDNGAAVGRDLASRERLGRNFHQ